MVVRRPHSCLRRLNTLPCSRRFSLSYSAVRLPSIAPKSNIDVKHIRENPDLYAQSATLRRYNNAEENPLKIIRLFDEWKKVQGKGRSLRKRSKEIRTKIFIANNSYGHKAVGEAVEPASGQLLLNEARSLSHDVKDIEKDEAALTQQIQSLAFDLPNLTSPETPVSGEPQVVGFINELAPKPVSSDERDHVHLGKVCDLIDFTSAATTTGWGWYYLKNEGALLEQALVQYALTVARHHAFQVVSPPSLVYSHVGSACGYKPRDEGNVQQIYAISQDEGDKESLKPGLSLAGTAEIPFAAMKANTEFHPADLPLRIVGPSRCYRAEAGARGAESKGLYRVHEFTKVEMFGWTMKDDSAKLFHEMLAIQHKILTSLGLPCRILEMPASDLGASAYRKRDIEAYFPSRRGKNEGWGEVTSTSMCTDYQTRRLSTTVRFTDGSLRYPATANGTAMAVPRVLAALLENGWDEKDKIIRIPKCLWPWMGKESIKMKPQGSLKEL
ncbi:MAG: hypothetical protein Q9195_003565 [Heterodermia aff. obscurata]